MGAAGEEEGPAAGEGGEESVGGGDVGEIDRGVTHAFFAVGEARGFVAGRFVELVDVGGEVRCVGDLGQADPERGVGVGKVNVAVEIEEFGVAPFVAGVGEDEGFVGFWVGLCVGDGVDEAGVDAWGGEDGGVGEAEDGGFKGGGGHGVAEEELQSEVGGIVVVEVGIDFVVVAVCLVGFFVRAVGPFYADLAGETFSTDMDAGEGEEEFGAPGSGFAC